MDFNFDRLRQLRTPEFINQGAVAEKPPELPPEQLSDSRQYRNTTKAKNAIQDKYRQTRVDGTNLYKIERVEQQPEERQNINKLQRQADNNQAKNDRAAAVYKEYQQNIKAAGQLISDITKGLNTAEDIHDLFLKAIKAICCMTNDNVLLNHAEETLKTVYGMALGEYKPLDLELAAVKERLYNLEEAVLWADAPDEKRRIENAIKWHKQRQEEINIRLAENKPKPKL